MSGITEHNELPITPAAGQSKIYGATEPTSYAFANSESLALAEFTGTLARAGSNVGMYANSLWTPECKY